MYTDELLHKIQQAEAIIGGVREQLLLPARPEALPSFSWGGRPAIDISPDGKIAIGRNGLEIEYRGDDSCPYGRSATRRKKSFEALVVHHTSPSHTTDWYVQYQIDGDRARGGHFGYHFYIAPSGQIIQGAPLTKRTNQVKPSRHAQRRSFGRHANNSNSIGITCARAGKPSFHPTSEQIASLEALSLALCDEFGIDFDKIYGHGEIQKDRNRTEGTSAAQTMRTWTATGTPVGPLALGLDQDAEIGDVDDGPIYALELADGSGIDNGLERLALDSSRSEADIEDDDDLDSSAMVWWSSDESIEAPLTSPTTTLNYTNQSAIRNKKCTGNFEQLLVSAVDTVYGPGCSINIYSGGQDRRGHGRRRTGSIRHDDYGQGGRAADVHVFDQNGQQIKGLELARLGEFWLASKFGGVGHEMRGGGIHLDEWTRPPPGGGMFWTYSYSQNQPWGAEARRVLERGARG